MPTLHKTRALRILLPLAAACLFGVGVAFVKGTDGGIRDQIGNLSAPWLLVGLFPAAQIRNLPKAATAGLTCTLIALSGFYLAVAVQTPSSSPHEVFAANRLWLYAGLVSGPVCGVVGSLLGRRGRWSLAACTAALLIAEPLAILLLTDAFGGQTPFGFSWGGGVAPAYRGELVVGAALLAVVLIMGFTAGRDRANLS